MQNLSQVGLALVILVGGYLVVHDHLQVGTILTFSFWIVMLQAPFQMLGMLIMLGQRASASAKRIYEVLDEQPTVVDRPGAVDLVECRGDVRFDAVTFGYDAGPAGVLDNFDLHLRPGRRWPWWAAPVAGSRRWPGCWIVSTTCPTERCGSTATTCGT